MILEKSNYKLRIIEDPNCIIKYLQLGTNIPIWPELYEYVLFDLVYFQAKSIVILEDGNVVANVLLYDDSNNTLFFGYFGVNNNDIYIINLLIDKIIEYGKKYNYKVIRGPINIPVIIYGWGFMKAGSKNSLFIGKPVNPPIYQELFLGKKFKIKHEQVTWLGSPLQRHGLLKKYNFEDYEYFNPIDLADFENYKNDFLRIHAKNLPESSRITPRTDGVIDNYVKFVFKYGHNCMIFFVRYKPKNEIVACGAFLPNPFRRDKNGKFDSCVIYTWAVNQEHRRKGLVMLMYNNATQQLLEKGIIYGAGPIPKDNLANTGFAKKMGGIESRSHLILEKEL